jgi:hypothetical protein
MHFGKFLLLCLGLLLVIGTHCRVAALGNSPAQAVIVADGGAPLPPPSLVADGGAPLPPPSLIVDVGAPLPPPLLVADGGAPLPPPLLIVDGGAPLPPPSSRSFQLQIAA